MAILAAGALLVYVAPASAHPGIGDPFVPVGVATTVALGVPSEEPAAMVEVDVTIPPDFTLQRLDPVAGWQPASSPGLIRFSGGNVAQGGYAQFTFTGIFAAKRVVQLPLVTRHADGTLVSWNEAPGDGVRHPAVVLYPGFAPGEQRGLGAGPQAPGLVAASGGGRRSVLFWGGVAVTATGLVLAGQMAARQRRRGRPSRPGRSIGGDGPQLSP